MNVDESSYILDIWFLGWGTGDWMGSVSKNKAGDFEIEYRFRYYKSKDAWDGMDEKNWYGGSTTERDEDKIIANMNGALAALKSARQEKCESDCVLVRGGTKKLLEAIKGKDWIHIKKEMVH